MARWHAARSRTASALSVGGEIAGLAMQAVLVWVGAELVWGADDPDEETLLRLVWCLVAGAYLAATVLGLNLLVRFDQPDPRATRVLVGHPLARALATLLTFGASVLGLSVAVDLITALGRGEHDPIAEFSAVCAMPLSWAMFNWGFARIYFSRYHRSPEPPLVFPGSAAPRLIDFVYFAFTNATTFSVSDVHVVSTRMRWTVVWHTTLAFFFNALIIALTMNVIVNGRLLSELFD